MPILEGDINMAVVAFFFMTFNLAMSNQINSRALHHQPFISSPTRATERERSKSGLGIQSHSD
mgnify:CR=1 FL=1